MSFDALPNELLAPILNHKDIPLQERIQLRAVSSRWLIVIEEGLKKETKLTINSPRPRKNFRKQPNLLVVNPKFFNGELFFKLAALFPSISELDVSFGLVEDYNFRFIPQLLAIFGGTLKSFSLRGIYDFANDDAAEAPIIDAINALTGLTSLQLFGCVLGSEPALRLAPTLARLEQFTLIDIGFPRLGGPELLASLSDRCTQLVLCEESFDWWDIKVGPSLTHLHLKLANTNLDKEWQEFTALTNLTVTFAYPASEVYLSTALLLHLSHLSQLTELNLNGLEYFHATFNPPPSRDRRLSRVTRLCLTLPRFFELNVNGKHFCKTLAAWFPALEQLQVICPIQYHAEIEANSGEFPKSTAVSVELYSKP